MPPKHRRGFLAQGSFETEMLTRQQSATSHPHIGTEGIWNHKFWMVLNSLLPALVKPSILNPEYIKSPNFNNHPTSFTYMHLSLATQRSALPKPLQLSTLTCKLFMCWRGENDENAGKSDRNKQWVMWTVQNTDTSEHLQQITGIK